MYKKIKQDGNVTMFGIEIPKAGVIVKLVDKEVDGVTVMYIPAVEMKTVTDANVTRRELAAIGFDAKGMADKVGKEFTDIFGGLDDVLKRG
jgi:hypothetical protein